jgi:predicted TIM-barrel fold metal-dependent hydrolase
MICDGVLERFPNLKIGMIELDHFYTKNYSDFLGVDTA